MMNTSHFNDLSELLGSENVITKLELRQKYSHDASTHAPVLPDVVVVAHSTSDVSKLAQYANDHKIPVTTRGRGTSLEGNAIPADGGIVLDLSAMSEVLEVLPDDFQVVVEPGITGDALNDHLKAWDLFFPAFPASSNIASLGGMIANNAGGMYAVKYGVVGNWVMDLEVVLADGKVIQVGSRSIKSVAGYNLKELFISSEGTLGIITKARLKVIPTVRHRQVLLISFQTVHQALAATQHVVREHVDPAAMELLDHKSIHYINQLKSLEWPEVPTLIIELHGTEAELPVLAKKVEQIATLQDAISFQIADTEEEMKAIWDARKAVHPAIRNSFPDAGIIPGDVGLPLSKIPDFMRFLEQITEQDQVVSATFGHIGDGNFHFWLVYDRKVTGDFEKVSGLAGKLVEKALALGGTCTAEHGVGLGKKKYLKLEHPDLIELMIQIKQLLDPHNILNPQKVF